MLTCFTVVFAKNDTATDLADIADLEKVVKDQTKTTANPGSKAAPTTGSKAAPTAKTTPKTTAPKTTAPVNTTCGSCETVNLNGCAWNQVEESRTDFHYDTIGNCPCPDDTKDDTKDRCNVVQRRIRNIPARQAWSASLFLLSICIAGKIHRIVRYYLYHFLYPRKSHFVTHRKIFILAHP